MVASEEVVWKRFDLGHPVGGGTYFKKSLLWGRCFPAGAEMVCSRDESLTHHIKLVKVYRVKKGAIVASVCKGLEASGKGTANGWRVLFLISGSFSSFQLLVTQLWHY